MGDTKDHEWLVARERGKDVSHVAVATRAPYEELGQLLAKLPGMAPRAGWQQRVFDKIDQGDAVPVGAPVSPRPALTSPKPALTPPRPARRRQWIAAGAVAVAAAAAIVIYLAVRPPTSPPPTSPRFGDRLAVISKVRDGDAVVRAAGVHAKIGDTLVVEAESPGPAELRAYRDTGELLAACGDGGGCTVERDGARRRFVFEVPLRVAGEVHVVLFDGERVPASRGSLPADIEAAKQVGVEVRPQGITPVN